MRIHTEISLARKASLHKIEMKFETMRERTLYLDHLKPRRPYEQNDQIVFLEKDLVIKKISLPITSPHFK